MTWLSFEGKLYNSRTIRVSQGDFDLTWISSTVSRTNLNERSFPNRMVNFWSSRNKPYVNIWSFSPCPCGRNWPLHLDTCIAAGASRFLCTRPHWAIRFCWAAGAHFQFGPLLGPRSQWPCRPPPLWSGPRTDHRRYPIYRECRFQHVLHTDHFHPSESHGQERILERCIERWIVRNKSIIIE